MSCASRQLSSLGAGCRSRAFPFDHRQYWRLRSAYQAGISHRVHTGRRPNQQKATCSCSSLRVVSRVMPDVPREWEPPSDPSAPGPPPEFIPPSDPGTTIRPLPEYTPPEQDPSREIRPSGPPLRPIRPEGEPDIPEPESPNADPVRTPERRKEISEPPSREQPEYAPERE